MKRYKFFTIMISISLVMTLFSYTSSLADSYVSPWIALNSSQGGNPGSTLQVTGYSFNPNASVSFSLGPAGGQLQEVATVNADSKGSFKTSITIPSTAKAGDKLMVQTTGGSSNPIALDFVVGKVSTGYQNIANMPSLYSTGPTSTYTYGYGFDSYWNSLINLPPYSRKEYNPNFNDHHRFPGMTGGNCRNNSLYCTP